MTHMNTLIGQDIFIAAWQYDFSKIVIDGVITGMESCEGKFGLPAFKLTTANETAVIERLVVETLLKGEHYRSNRMLNNGCNATLNPVRTFE